MTKEAKKRISVENKGSKGIIVYVLIPVLIVLAFVFIQRLSGDKEINDSYNNIAFIRQYMNNGKLDDYSNQVGMHDPETDIRWYKNKDEIKIEFGYITMKFTVDEIKTDYCKNELGSIGIKFKVLADDDGTYKLRMYYNNKEIERWI